MPMFMKSISIGFLAYKIHRTSKPTYLSINFYYDYPRSGYHNFFTITYYFKAPKGALGKSEE